MIGDDEAAAVLAAIGVFEPRRESPPGAAQAWAAALGAHIQDLTLREALAAVAAWHGDPVRAGARWVEMTPADLVAHVRASRARMSASSRRAWATRDERAPSLVLLAPGCLDTTQIPGPLALPAGSTVPAETRSAVAQEAIGQLRSLVTLLCTEKTRGGRLPSRSLGPDHKAPPSTRTEQAQS